MLRRLFSHKIQVCGSTPESSKGSSTEMEKSYYYGDWASNFWVYSQFFSLVFPFHSLVFGFQIISHIRFYSFIKPMSTYFYCLLISGVNKSFASICSCLMLFLSNPHYSLHSYHPLLFSPMLFPHVFSVNWLVLLLFSTFSQVVTNPLCFSTLPSDIIMILIIFWDCPPFTGSGSSITKTW